MYKLVLIFEIEIHWKVKPVIGPTKYPAKHIYKMMLNRTYSQNLRSAHISTLVMTCLRAEVTK